MRIVMTGRAVLIREVILPGGRCGRGCSRDSERLVTVRAQHGDMRSCEYKLRLGVAREIIRGRRERNLRVTGFAAVRIRRSGELFGVHVRVALRTSRGFQLVFRISPGGLVALRAFNGGVLALQRKETLLVLLPSVL